MYIEIVEWVWRERYTGGTQVTCIMMVKYRDIIVAREVRDVCVGLLV